jgi:hypothetical protein
LDSGELSDNAAHGKFYVSDSQHGTKMAWLIHRVCPFATIYVAKLSRQRGSQDLKNPSFRPEDAVKVRIPTEIFLPGLTLAFYLVQAIDWAVSQDVDIISMSWHARDAAGSGDPSTSNANEVAALKQAIRRASDKHILMFGAGCNNKTFPDEKLVPCGLVQVWSVGATDAFSNPKEYVDINKVTYLFPGEHVLGVDDHEDGDVGNSGATALAAGLAAMVLFLVRAQDIGVPDDKHTWLAKIMEYAFKWRETSKVIHLDILEKAPSRAIDHLRDILVKFEAAGRA